MAKIILENNKKEAQIPNGNQIKDTCELLGVPFGCKQGICGTCIIEVAEGMINLEVKNEREEEKGLFPNQRLACQCVIKGGTLRIKV